MDPDDVSAVNVDDDTAGITVEPTSGLVTSEDGGSDTFSVVLDAQPSADVTIGISSSDTSEGTVDTASLTFTSTDWDTPQTVTVTGVGDDEDPDGDVLYSIVTAPAVSEDSNYNTLDPADVSVTNTDNDGQVEPDVYESTDTPLDIADAHPVKGPMTTTSELVISSPDTIGSLDLVISLDDGSSDVSDLAVTLTSDDGTEKEITPLDSGTTTYEDVGFGGESLGGTWTLAMTDSVKANRHTLNSWSLLVVPETTSTSSSTTTLLAAGSLEPQDSTEPVTDTSTTEPALSSNSEPERGMAADALLPPRQLAEPSLDLLAADRLTLSGNYERGSELAIDQALDELLAGMEDPDPLDDLVLALA